MTETVERCPECDRPKAKDASARSGGCKRGLLDDRGQPYRSRCHELTIARLRAELATLREREQLESAVVEAAIEFIGPTGEDASSLDTAVEALLAHRQRNNDGNR